MHVTLKMVEKLDDLLDEASEYVDCASAHFDDNELKSAYLDLARCHYDGYEKLAKCCERAVERKSKTSQHGSAITEMYGWYKPKFEKRAADIKQRLDQAR